MPSIGYIKIYRTILDHWIYASNKEEPYDRFHAWMDLLLSANFETTRRRFKGKPQVTYPGQLQTSLDFLSKKWNWSRGKVDRFLNTLSEDGMITQNRTADGTTITIENWRKFQGRSMANDMASSTAFDKANDTAGDTTGSTTGDTTGGIHNKKDKKYKNVNNTPLTPQEGVVGENEDPLFDAKAFLDSYGG